jgi:tripartite-type tricarboxylate transporter receptor subunit TctC
MSRANSAIRPRRCPRAWPAILLALGALLLVPGAAALAQGYPVKLIKLVVGNPPGGPTDIVGRIVAQQLAEGLGQQVIVENRAGANGIIAIEGLAKAPPDGYTLLLAASGQLAVNVSLYRKLPYDPVKDLAPVILVASAPMALLVNPALPAGSVQELIALLKARPGGYSYASAGNGTTQHLTGELFKSMAEVKMAHVPYKGSPPALNDLIGGQVPIAFDAVFSALPQIKGGRIRALATTGSVRSNVLPEVPTVAEAGLPGFESNAWFGLVAPQGTPQAVLEKLNAVLDKALATRELKARLRDIGLEPASGSPEQFGAFIKAEIAKWNKVVRESGMTVD